MGLGEERRIGMEGYGGGKTGQGRMCREGERKRK